jgi:hypothetical protein
MRKRKVYITQRGYHRYDKAARYGEFVDVTTGRVDVLHTDRLIANIQEVLSDMNEGDWLLLSGGPLISAICVGYALNRFGHVNILYWDSLLGDYIPREGLDFVAIPEFHQEEYPEVG